MTEGWIWFLLIMVPYPIIVFLAWWGEKYKISDTIWVINRYYKAHTFVGLVIFWTWLISFISFWVFIIRTYFLAWW